MSLPSLQTNIRPTFSLVSQLLQGNPSAGVSVKPVSRASSFYTDHFALSAPGSLFRSVLPVLSGIGRSVSSLATATVQTVALSNLQGSTPAQQLQLLGRKYGVPANSNPDKYQSNVIQAIIRAKAAEYGIPEHVALGISGNESGWKMWKNVNSGELVQGKNLRDGELKSTDWGAMQINDKAHAKAFPRAKQDLEYNIDYALRFLAKQRETIKGDLGHGLGDWDRTVASYNLGHNPKTQRGYQIAAQYVGRVSDRAEQFA